jgi:hypothetical protein
VAEPTTAECIGPEEFLDYFEGIVPQERDAEIEAHLEVCSACQTMARRTLAFSAAWDEWAAPSVGETDLAATVAAALQKAEETVPAWRVRLVKWRKQWARRAQAGVRVIVEAPGKASRVIREEIEAGFGPGGPGGLAFATVRTRGAVRSRGEGAGPSAPTPGAREAGLPDVRVEFAGRDVVVRVAGFRPGPGEPAPLAMLVPATEGSEPIIQETQGPHEGEFAARFEGVGPGDYIVVVEPSGRADA